VLVKAVVVTKEGGEEEEAEEAEEAEEEEEEEEEGERALQCDNKSLNCE
jgi:hypothetical protein